MEICGLVSVFIKRKTKRSSALPVLLQVVYALRFLAEGSKLTITSDSAKFQISRSSVWRVVRGFCKAIVTFSSRYIKFPTGQEDLLRVKQGFKRIAGFPNVCGLVDGTIIEMCETLTNTEDFICRKMFPALNIQICCGPDNLIYQATVKWPGATHDSFIFEHSGLKLLVEDCTKGVLLGDNGYPLRPYLLVPFKHCRSQPEKDYNDAQKKTRVRVEHTIGILKSRFQILKDGVNTQNPEFVVLITQSCIVLHNMAVQLRDFIEIGEQDAQNTQVNTATTREVREHQSKSGNEVRDMYVQKYFS